MKKHITAFYLETLLLTAVFVGIILVLTGVFGRAAARSAQARRLTHAVTLAENAAEALAAADSDEALTAILAAEGDVQASGDTVVLTDGAYTATILRTPQGGVTAGHITVTCSGQELYTLDTAVYTGRAG